MTEKINTDTYVYSNGVTDIVMTPQEFERGGYAMQAFVRIGPADPDSRVDGAQQPKATTDKATKKEKK